jgi:23S rRNA (uracil1939-C5)-methyltransferase
MPKRGDIVDLTIGNYAFGGKGIAKFKEGENFLIIFVQNGIPGQKVNAKITKKKKSFAEAIIVEIITPSPIQIKHDYQPISGAPYIDLPIEEQKNMKKQVCLEVFEKIGKLENPAMYFDEWIASPATHHYRNKMEYSFSCIEYDLSKKIVVDDAFALGFKRKGTWWMVENLNKDSGLFDEELENKLYKIKNFLFESKFKAWHPPQKIGFFRHLVVRKSYYSNQLLFNLVTSSENKQVFDVAAFGEFLKKQFKDRLAGLIYTINDDVADREKLDKGASKLVLGSPTIIEKINDLEFEISMQSFFQTNPKCAEKLYQKVIDYILESSIPEDKFIMDLFCGTGTIAQLIAKAINNKILGVDIVPSAIENAKNNAKKNQLSNIKFLCDDVGKFLLNNPNYNNKIHTIVLDPPRAGIAPKSLRKVIRLNAEKIIYVSCNPATQARDLLTLYEMGYVLEKFSLIDQFPHTAHVESIMLFKKSAVKPIHDRTE